MTDTSKDVERFRPSQEYTDDTMMLRDKSGNFVYYSDYADLLVQLEAANARADRAREDVMSDAPETIWARPDPYEPDWTGDKMLRSKAHVEYRRADLVAPATLPMPPTNAQLMANDRVRALVEALEKIRDRHVPDQPAADGADEVDYIRKHHLELRIIARAALAQLKEPT